MSSPSRPLGREGEDAGNEVASIAAYYKFNLSIAHQNINSFQNKMDEITTLLNQELFDILVLTETKTDTMGSDLEL